MIIRLILSLDLLLNDLGILKNSNLENEHILIGFLGFIPILLVILIVWIIGIRNNIIEKISLK